MAAVYRAGRGGRVVVREARGARTLEIDGTFASWWRPGTVTTRSVWDALAAPLLALPPARRRAVAILGLGGGSAARLVRALAPRARIVGIELDADVLRAARRWFALDALDVEVHQEDALAWLRRTRTRFDLVIDDVFLGSAESVHKPAWMLEVGLPLAARRLAAGGVLVSNALDEAAAVGRALAGLLPQRLELRIDGFDNRVFAASTRPLSARALRSALAAEPAMRDSLPVLGVRTVRGR
ncbi:MAG: fused MFS/spermidine synthase [Myxococcota bacterium]|nr:fused MFS/spermidine synthase [Myxococcota bacterium]